MTGAIHLAMSMPIETLMMIGALGGLVVVMLSYANWRKAVKLSFVILLFEGAIRKWGFPQGQELIYFLKDGVLFGAYLKFFFAPDPGLRAWRINAPYGWIALFCACVCLSALNPNIGSPLLALYGIKVYLYYLPLAFMVPFLWQSQAQMLRELTWYAMLAIPICVLGLAQSRVGADSPLNCYAVQNPDATVAMFAGTESTRVTGTFSYLTGHTTFIIFFFALHVALLTTNLKKIYWWILILDLPLLFGNALAGGARASIISMATIVAGFVGSSWMLRSRQGKNILLVLTVGSIIAMIGVAAFFSEAKDRWMTRFETSGTVSERVVDFPLITLSRALKDCGVMGYGIGMTHPAVSALRRGLSIPPPKDSPPSYDMEVAQILVELGYLGMAAWYALRLLVMWQTFSSFRRCPPGPLRALLLAATLVEIPHFLLSVVLNHTANFLIFASYGLALIPRLQRIGPAPRRVAPQRSAGAVRESRSSPRRA